MAHKKPPAHPTSPSTAASISPLLSDTDSDFDEPPPYAHIRVGPGLRQEKLASSSRHWVPNGIRPPSAAVRQPQSTIGAKKSKAIESFAVFPDDRELKEFSPSQFFWLYGAFDFKLQCPIEDARSHVFKMIDKLVAKMKSLVGEEYTTTMSQLDEQMMSSSSPFLFSSSHHHESRPRGNSPHARPSSAMSNFSSAGTSSSAKKEPRAKGHLIFDIISTKKHIRANYTTGLPYQLGMDIYEYVDTTHHNCIVTSFVGLTDNTARRVGRDAYYHHSVDLSKTQIDFACVDNEHLYIVFPPMSSSKSKAPPKTILPGKRPMTKRAPSPQNNRMVRASTPGLPNRRRSPSPIVKK